MANQVGSILAQFPSVVEAEFMASAQESPNSDARIRDATSLKKIVLNRHFISKNSIQYYASFKHLKELKLVDCEIHEDAQAYLQTAQLPFELKKD